MMASSSVSQDDLHFDFEKSSRRSRIRTARARQINNAPQDCDSQSQAGSLEAGGHHQHQMQGQHEHQEQDGNANDGEDGAMAQGGPPRNQDTSPKQNHRSVKEKRSGKLLPLPSHSHSHLSGGPGGKGKAQRDRRKLREKRRSTGVVHLASTESTGGTTTGDDEESSDAVVTGMCAETKRNTMANESSPMPAAGQNARPGSDQLQLASNEEEEEDADADEDYSVDEDSPRKPHHGHHHHHHSYHHHHHKHQKPGSILRNAVQASDLEADDENDHDSLNPSEDAAGASSSGTGTASEAVAKAISGAARLAASNSSAPVTGPSSQMERVVEENRRLLSLMEEKDKRIQLLEIKIQQLMGEGDAAAATKAKKK